MADRVGQQFGNYRLVRLLGHGGFAEVYLGEHLQLGTHAALKLLHTHIGTEDVEFFRKEARTIAHLVHPHIVRVFDFGVEGTIPFLVMDYAPGGTVRKRYPRGVALPLPTIVTYVTQTAEALQYAHDEHVIHRDMKPENLLLGRRQEVLLSDFGIAQLAQSSRSQSTQDVAGTAGYMAPEQFQGKPRPASDQYALGIIVYEWLSGDRPFHGSFTEVASQHLFVPPPPLREKVPAISAAIEQVVLTALTKDPRQRFGSVRAFATALEQACQATLTTMPTVLPGDDQESIPTQVISSPAGQSSYTVDAISSAGAASQTVETDPFAPLATPPAEARAPIVPARLPAEEAIKPAYQVLQTPPQASGTSGPPVPIGWPPSSDTPSPVISTQREEARTGRGFSRGRNIGIVALVFLLILSGSGLFYMIMSNRQADEERARRQATTQTQTAIAEAQVAQARATAQAQATATAIATALMRNPYAPQQSKLVLQDPLKDNSRGSGWEEKSNQYGLCGFAGNGYHTGVPNGYGGQCFARNTDFDNFTYEIHMKFVKGTIQDPNVAQASGATIDFRASSDTAKFYELTIFMNGLYDLGICDLSRNTCAQTIPPNTFCCKKAASFHPGLNKSNTIAIVADQATLTIYINGQRVLGPVNDTTYTSGLIGVGADGGSAESEVEFSDLKVWTA